MAIVKVIEVIAQSDKSWQHAAQEAIRLASKTVRNINHIYLKDMQGIVEDNEIVLYRVNANISFLVDDED